MISGSKLDQSGVSISFSPAPTAERSTLHSGGALYSHLVRPNIHPAMNMCAKRGGANCFEHSHYSESVSDIYTSDTVRMS